MYGGVGEKSRGDYVRNSLYLCGSEMRRLLVLAVLFLVGLPLLAAEPDRPVVPIRAESREESTTLGSVAEQVLAPAPPDTTLFSRAVNFVNRTIDWFYELPPVKLFNARDTTYYSSPAGDWTIKVRSNLSGTRMNATARSDETDFRTRLTARHNFTQSIGVTYKGITLSYSFNPWQRDWHDIKYDLSAYSNMAGIDITYRTISSFRGYAESEGERLGDIAENQVSHHLLGINALYFFNYQQYSFPACFNQSYIQHRSAGSFIAGLSYGRDQTYVPSVSGSPEINVDSRLLALGVGYGYTYVPQWNEWEFMVAFLPKLVVYDSGRLKVDYDTDRPVGYDFRQHFRLPEFNLNGYFAAVKWFRQKYFVALTAAADGYNLGKASSYRLTALRWETHLALGFRF